MGVLSDLSGLVEWYSDSSFVSPEKFLPAFEEKFGSSYESLTALLDLLQSSISSEPLLIEAVAGRLSLFSDVISPTLRERVAKILGRTIPGPEAPKGEVKKKKKKKKKTAPANAAAGSCAAAAVAAALPLVAKGKDFALMSCWERAFSDGSIDDLIMEVVGGAPVAGPGVNPFLLLQFEIEKEIDELFGRLSETKRDAQMLIEIIARMCAGTASLGSVVWLREEETDGFCHISTREDSKCEDRKQGIEKSVYTYCDARQEVTGQLVGSLVKEGRFSAQRMQRIGRLKRLLRFFSEVVANRQIEALKSYPIGSRDGSSLVSSKLLLDSIAQVKRRHDFIAGYLAFNAKISGYSRTGVRPFEELAKQMEEIYCFCTPKSLSNPAMLIELHRRLSAHSLKIEETVRSVYEIRGEKERPYPFMAKPVDDMDDNRLYLVGYLRSAVVSCLDLTAALLLAHIREDEPLLIEGLEAVVESPLTVRSDLFRLEQHRLVVGDVGQYYAQFVEKEEMARGLTGNREFVERLAGGQAQVLGRVTGCFSDLAADSSSIHDRVSALLGLSLLVPVLKESFLRDATKDLAVVENLISEALLLDVDAYVEVRISKWVLIQFLETYTAAAMGLNETLAAIQKGFIDPVSGLKGRKKEESKKKGAPKGKGARQSKGKKLSPSKIGAGKAEAASPLSPAHPPVAIPVESKPVLSPPVSLSREADGISIEKECETFVPEEREEVSSSEASEKESAPEWTAANWKTLKEAAHKLLSASSGLDRDFASMVLSGGLRSQGRDLYNELKGETVKTIIRELELQDWSLDRVKGDHHIYKHPCLLGLISIPYSRLSDTLSPGVYQKLAEIAGWRDTGRRLSGLAE